MLSEASDTLQELQRLHQLNIELLEQLDVTFSWLISNHIKLPNESAFYSLVLKARALMTEIQTGEPVIKVRKLADENLQRKHNRREVYRTHLTAKQHESSKTSFNPFKVPLFLNHASLSMKFSVVNDILAKLS